MNKKYDRLETKSDSFLSRLIASRWTAAMVGGALVGLAVAFIEFGMLFCG